MWLMLKKSAQAILKLFHSKGVQYLPAALKCFQAKTISQFLYGTMLGAASSCCVPLENLQLKILRAAFLFPSCVSRASLHVDSGLIKVETRVTLAPINFWFKLNYSLQGLTSLILRNCF